MSGKSRRRTAFTIASYRPIGKAEAADCISPVKGRELKGDDDDDHDSEQKMVFLPLMIRGR